MTDRPVYVLGLNTYDHDVSACLLRDGEIRYAITKERITREKHDTGFHQEVVDYCLDAEGISLSQVDLVVRNCYVLPVEDLEERLLYEDVPEFLDPEDRWDIDDNPLFLPDEPSKYITVSHHVAHAYSAFAACPFDEGAVMIVDGVGSYAADVKEPNQLTEGVNPLSRESESYYTFKGNDLTAIKKIWLEPTRGFLSDEFMFMPGLGALYSRVSCYIFGDWNKCGEVMGLAPYGRPNKMAPLLSIKEDGELHIPHWTREFDKPWLGDLDEDWEESPKVQHWRDLAWQMQDDTERVLLHRAKWLRETTGAKYLCIAGGVGLNCVANGKISREAGFDDVWVQPAAGDDGIAIGCAYYGYIHVLKKQRNFEMKHAYLGKTYTDEQVNKATSGGFSRFEIIKSRSDDICRETAQLLKDGNVLGWFQGRSEFGPRALGNRSIISDPRTSEMKDKLNKRVKHRQAFRPFAPIVIYERAKEIFEGEHDSPFMLMAHNVRPEWRDRLQGITHVDGTARIQTVRAETNPRLYKLLEEFNALTGVPVLLNTSFNVKGEPIVETPQDAVNCFLSTGIDYLAIHDLLLRKSQFNKIAAPARRVYGDMSTMIRSGVE